jgi:hypothetical protein
MPVRRYRLIVEGELGPHFANGIDDVEIESAGGRSMLVAATRDQAELLGLIGRVAGLGLTLVSVAPADSEPRQSA